MNIRYLGHACFLMESASGTKIVTDPYDNTIGYEMPKISADIITVSHQHHDHNYTEGISGPNTVIDSVGDHIIKDVKIKGIFTYHDEVKGDKRGENIVFSMSIDGINICHCGDLGHILEKTQVEELGQVDILMVPIGGVYTIDAKEAVRLVNQIKPKLVLPMHYKTPELNFEIGGINEFLEAIGDGERVGGSQIQVTADTLENFKGVRVLDY